MKRLSNGGGSLDPCVIAICCCLALLLGCLALSAECRPQQLLKNVRRTRALFIDSTSGPGNTSIYHTDMICPVSEEDGDDAKKIRLIFCAIKCYCHGARTQCYCCQNVDPSGPVCYDQLNVCKANCPICNPECPPGGPGTATAMEEEGHQQQNAMHKQGLLA